jgi:hypothetical protein
MVNYKQGDIVGGYLMSEKVTGLDNVIKVIKRLDQEN